MLYIFDGSGCVGGGDNDIPLAIVSDDFFIFQINLSIGWFRLNWNIISRIIWMVLLVASLGPAK